MITELLLGMFILFWLIVFVVCYFINKHKEVLKEIDNVVSENVSLINKVYELRDELKQYR